MKKLLTMFFALFAMTFLAKAQIIEDFESYTAFTVDPAGIWTYYDGDSASTFGINGCTFTNANYVGSCIVFNPSQTSPSCESNHPAHSGSQYLVMFNAVPSTIVHGSTTNDWLISPAISSTTGNILTLYAREITTNYGAETMNILYSTTGNNPEDFTLLQTEAVNSTSWTSYSYNIPANATYIAINCTSYDIFGLCIDDISITPVPGDPSIASVSSLNLGNVILPNNNVATVPVQVWNLTSALTASSSDAVFELSFDGTNFASTATISNPVDSTYTLYVKFTPTTGGTATGVITLSSTGATSMNVALTGNGVNCSNNPLPYSFAFDNVEQAQCWTTVDVNNDANGSYGAILISTSNGYAFYQYLSNAAANDWLISPTFYIPENGAIASFDYKVAGSEYPEKYSVYVIPAGSTYTNANTIVATQTVDNEAYETQYLDLDAFAGQSIQIAIKVESDADQYAILFSNFFIGDNICLPAINLTASNITPHGATLTWSGDANSYTIYDMSDTSFVATVNDTICNLSNLTSDSQYSFGVVANCTSGNSNMVIVNFHTQISCPVPTGLNVTYNPNVPTEVTLSWTENGTATQWQLVLNNDEANIIDVNQNPYTLTDLIIDSTYTVKVRANCDVDEQSAWSATTSFEPTTKTVIGSGNSTSSYLPTYSLYNYSLSQQIYTVAELGDAGLIESIDLYNNGNSALTRDLSIYMVSTAKDTFANASDWISVSAADLQYSGNVTFAPGAWTTITLDGFSYDGLNNVAIIVDDNTGSWVSGAIFKVFGANKQALRIYSDGTNYDVTAPAYNGTVMNVKNQVRLTKGELASCLKPAGVTINYTGGLTAEVSWTSDAPSFNISVNDVVTNNVTSPYTLTGLSLGTTYSISLQAICDTNSTSDWTHPVSLITDACMPEDKCAITIVGTDSYGDGWGSASITVMQNGTSVGSFTVSGSSTTTSYNVCHNAPVSFVWNTGGYFDNECNFTILFSDSIAAFSGNGDDVTGTFYTLENACPSCAPTANLAVDTTTENSITISWTGTAASYNVYNGENFVANVTTTSYTFSGLTASTLYMLGVQAVCSADDSSMVVTISAMTECAEITPLPYHESFDHSLGCWSTVNASIDGEPWDYMDNISYAHTGTGAAASYSYTTHAMHADAWLISPKFVLPTVTDDSLSLSWWHRVNVDYPHELYDVMISTTTNDISSFTTTLLSVSPDSINGYVQKMVNITAYAGQEIYIAFHHHDSYDQSYLIIDDIDLFEGGYVPPTSDTLTMTLAVNDPTMGTTVPAPGVHYYFAGENAPFEAQANPGHQFVMWVISYDNADPDTLVGEDYASGYYFIVNNLLNAGIHNVTLNAYFEATANDSLIFNLSINNPALGSITPAPGSYAIALNDSIVLHATPNEGANFQGWRVIIAGQTLATVPLNPFSIPVSPNNITLGEMTIVALFSDSTSVPDSMTITINTADPTMGTTNPAPGTYNFAVGSTSYVTAVPNEGYHLLYWVEYLEIAGMSVSDTLIADTVIVEVFPIMAGMVSSLTAHFEADEPATDSLIINLTINNPTLGTINPNPGTYAVALNDVMMITATPNDGVTFEGYRVYWNGQIITNVPAVANPFPCTVTPDLLNFGEITIMALFSDGSSVPDSLTLIVNTNDATMGTTNPVPGTYKYAVGDTSVLSAIPNDGYHFLYWIESVSVAGITMNDTIYAPVLTTLINQMMADMTLTVTAYFEANEPGVNYYTVIVRSANTAMGTVSSDIPLGQLAENTVVTVTATPRTGYQFVNWTDGEGNIINATNPYTFTVTEDITLVANFELADGINDIDASNVLIYAHNSTITVRGAEGHDVFVYDMNGRCIYQHADVNETETINMSSAGIYLVRIDNAIFKKVVIVK